MTTHLVRSIDIAGRRAGDGCPPFIIAEAGVNHNGSTEMALRLVGAAKEAGADAVKFQTFYAHEVVTGDGRKAGYQEAATGAGSQFEMLRALELSDDGHLAVRERCRELGILFLSTPHGHISSLRRLAALEVPAFKFGSGDLTNIPLLEEASLMGKPMLVSTGMASRKEIVEAVCRIRGTNPQVPLALFHCTSAYPCPQEESRLRAITVLRMLFPDLHIGFSDHTEGSEAAVFACRMGARIFEKHLTLDRGLPGPDQRASLDPQGFVEYASAIRTEAFASEASSRKIPHAEVGRYLRIFSGPDDPFARSPGELALRDVARKSLVLARLAPAGHVLREEDLTVKRPGTGIPPKRLASFIGRKASRELLADHLLREEDVV